MSIIIRVIICIAGILLIGIAFRAIVTRKLTERQSIFWMLAGVIIGVFGIFPKLIYIIADLFGVDYPPSIAYSFAIIFVIYGIFSCYRTNAELSAKVQELAIQVALLNAEKDMENKKE